MRNSMKYKYLELKDLRTTGTIERVCCSKLTKKEFPLKYPQKYEN